MTEAEWSQILHFKPTEITDPTKIQFSIMSELERWRDYTEMKTLIISSTGGVHLNDSQHYLGLAIDCMIVDRPNSTTFLDLCFSVFRFNFTGIGIYPDTRYTDEKGRILRGSFHLDMRQPGKLGERALWIGVKPDGKMRYLPLSEANLRAFGGIK